MQCPKCQFENRERANFCSECGHNFGSICPKCNTQIIDNGKFCDECGSSLIPTPFQRIEKLGLKFNLLHGFPKYR